MMDPLDSRRNSRRICLVLLNRFGKFFVCTTNLAHKLPFALRKLCLDRLKGFLFVRTQAELLVNPFMATDSGLRAQRSKHLYRCSSLKTASIARVTLRCVVSNRLGSPPHA